MQFEAELTSEEAFEAKKKLLELVRTCLSVLFLFRINNSATLLISLLPVLLSRKTDDVLIYVFCFPVLSVLCV